MPNLFQRRHLEFLAALIRDTDSLTPFERRSVAIQWAHKLRPTNSRFNVDRFIEAATQGLEVTGRNPLNPYSPVPQPVVIPDDATCAAYSYNLWGTCREPATHVVRTPCGTGVDATVESTFFCANHAESQPDAVPGVPADN